MTKETDFFYRLPVGSEDAKVSSSSTASSLKSSSWSSSTSSPERPGVLLCPRAMAYGSVIRGIHQQPGDGTAIAHDRGPLDTGLQTIMTPRKWHWNWTIREPPPYHHHHHAAGLLGMIALAANERGTLLAALQAPGTLLLYQPSREGRCLYRTDVMSSSESTTSSGTSGATLSAQVDLVWVHNHVLLIEMLYSSCSSSTESTTFIREDEEQQDRNTPQRWLLVVPEDTAHGGDLSYQDDAPPPLYPWPASAPYRIPLKLDTASSFLPRDQLVKGLVAYVSTGGSISSSLLHVVTATTTQAAATAPQMRDDEDNEEEQENEDITTLFSVTEYDLLSPLNTPDHHEPLTGTTRTWPLPPPTHLSSQPDSTNPHPPRGWYMDPHVGFCQVQATTHHDGEHSADSTHRKTFLVTSLRPMIGPSAVLAWLEPTAGTLACSWTVSSSTIGSTSSTMSKMTSAFGPPTVDITAVLDLEPLPAPPGAVAVALVVQRARVAPRLGQITLHPSGFSSSRSATASSIMVVQAIVEETMGLMVLGHPHVLYEVSCSEPSGRCPSALSALPSSSEPSYYSFWWAEGNGNSTDVHVFSPPPTDRVGKVRWHVAQGQWEEAEALFLAYGGSGTDAFSGLHAQEVTLRRLQALLQGGGNGGDLPMETLRVCMQKLATAALESTSGHLNGDARSLAVFLEATNMVFRTRTAVPLPDLVTGLSWALQTLSKLDQKLQEDDPVKSRVQSHQTSLTSQLAAWQFLLERDPTGQAGIPYDRVRSPSQLLQALMEARQLALARQLWRSDLRHQIPVESLVASLLRWSAQDRPLDYVTWLEEVVFPSLLSATHHEVVPALRGWACRVADDLDELQGGQDNADDGGNNSIQQRSDRRLDAAIRLLETVDRGLKTLQVSMYASFATFEPFVEKANVRSPRNQDSSSGSATERRRITQTRPQLNGIPAPTILEMGAVRSGASQTKLRLASLGSRTSEDDYDLDEDCVAEKLSQAKCLQQARLLGLGRHVLTLRHFVDQGGHQLVVRELIQHSSAASTDHQARSSFLEEKVRPFCVAFGVSYDDALVDTVAQLCQGKDITEQAIQESSSIAQCCISLVTRSKAVLSVVRAALLCSISPPWLLQQAREAIGWASCDSALQSEIQEAARLLSIDRLVLKYCGSGARELFRVDNYRHSVRLLQYMSTHFEQESVIGDVISLCEAFTHLSPFEACSSVLAHAVDAGAEYDVCASILDKLLDVDTVLAHKVIVRTIAVVDEILLECAGVVRSSGSSDRCEHQKMRAQLVCSHASKLVDKVVELRPLVNLEVRSDIKSYFGEDSFEGLRDALVRVGRLQTAHSIYLSITELASRSLLLAFAVKQLEDVAQDVTANDGALLNTRITAARKACALMCGRSKEFDEMVWASAVARGCSILLRESKDDYFGRFLKQVGMTDGDIRATFVPALLSVAMQLFHGSSKADRLGGVKRLTTALSLIQDWALSKCDDMILPTVVELSSPLDFVIQTLFSVDESVGEFAETFRQQQAASRWPGGNSEQESAASTPHARLQYLSRPLLYSTWYVGDGLLLPVQLLQLCVEYYRYICFDACTHASMLEMRKLIGDRGAYSLELRMIACITSTRYNCRSGNKREYSLIASAYYENVRLLAERSLGGTGTGMTNSIIDAQLAVAFLLTLQMKLGFSLLTNCIPTAIKTSDFARVAMLAQVGLVAAGDKSVYPVAWRGQHKFADQCRNLFARAKWWSFLKSRDVIIESRRFEELSESAAVAEDERSASTMFAMLTRLSNSLPATELTEFGIRYAETFGLSRQFVVQTFLEFLLLAPYSGLLGEANALPASDVSCYRTQDLVRCETDARVCLCQYLPSAKRADILRRCLSSLEASTKASRDYERLLVVVTLYQETLAQTVATNPTTNVSQAIHDLELADRRRDALTFLMSFFPADKAAKRPAWQSMFIPIDSRLPLDQPSRPPTRPFCGVLGNRDGMSAAFDPLSELQEFLYDSAAVTSLAPLCAPLGLPSGYIHARSLILRFERSSSNGGPIPSIEHDVLASLNKLRSPHDRLQLAEWCSLHCSDTDSLQCLELALQYALEAATMCEGNRRRDDRDSHLASLESQSLDAVRRLTIIRAALSDRLRVQAILRSNSDTGLPAPLSSLCNELALRLNQRSKEVTFPAETLIDFLLSEGSKLAANASIRSESALTVQQLRQFARSVFTACRAISDQYSHIKPWQHVKRFADQWLFHGDDITLAPNEETSQQSRSPAQTLPIESEEETIRFVMDLAKLSDDGGGWGGDMGNICTRSVNMSSNLIFSSEEEPSAVKLNSAREMSEVAAQRAALRIAFVLAMADEATMKLDSPNDKTSLENFASHANVQGKTKRVGLLASLETKRDSRQESAALERSRDLLCIVFAAHSGMSSSLLGKNSSFSGEGQLSHTVTFAMRHRALKAASILCPQEALEQVVQTDHFLDDQPDSPCALRSCTFGVFVAKEIEEMGLPLPHSDLARLSTMHFPSYARTLWRHYRSGSDHGRIKGRLLLLLLEMCLRNDTRNSSLDVTFVEALLQQLMQWKLPRSLLLAIERITNTIETSEHPSTHPLRGSTLREALDTAIHAVVLEVESLLISDEPSQDLATTENDLANQIDAAMKRVFQLASRLDYDMASWHDRVSVLYGHKALESTSGPSLMFEFKKVGQTTEG